MQRASGIDDCPVRNFFKGLQMNPPSRLLTRSFLVGMLVISTAQGASALTVTRCNQLDDGVYRPVLVIEHNGETHVHAMGEDGLTRSILFNADAALAWAQELYGADATIPATYSDNCGSPSGSADLLAMSDDDDDDDDEGGGTF
jgi:hypothetical protein